jgi:group II intron reverse transcriptase/maturase
MTEPLSFGDVSTRLRRIAELAKRAPDLVFTSLAHVIDVEFLKEAYARTRKDGAVGVDGQTAEEYGRDLERNLLSLLDRFKSGTYHAPPVKRVLIPKGDGRSRPIGIPTFEDKVLQRAVAMVLGAVYEQDFLGSSYGFRPGRSAHQALSTLKRELVEMGGGWVVEVDIQSFFDTLDPRVLRSFLDQRVRDGVLRRAIDKWLKAGVLEEGSVKRTEKGTPQGGVISPLLSNIYLHHVMDGWFENEVKPRMKGRTQLVRYADDLVMTFAREEDARKAYEVLPKRFAKYGLTLHPDKTRLLDFRRPAGPAQRRGDDGPGAPGSFDFLGFTHHWHRRVRGRWDVRQKTAKSRLSRALKRIAEFCRKGRHLPIGKQHETLKRKIQGHYNYFGVTGNYKPMAKLQYFATKLWFKWLNRRSQRKSLSWERFKGLLERFPLPAPRIVHGAIT